MNKIKFFGAFLCAISIGLASGAHAASPRWCATPNCVKPAAKTPPVVTRQVTSNSDNSVTFITQFNFSQPTAAQGSTIYGYADIVPTYGNLDIGATLDLSGRLVQNAQTLAGQAHSDFSALSAQAINGITEVARIKATEQAAVAALNAAGSQGGTSSGVVQSRVFSFEASIAPDGTMTVRPSGGDADVSAGVSTGNADSIAALGNEVRRVAATSCIECHNATDKKGNLDLTDPTVVPIDRYVGEKGILKRIVSSDPAVKMPPGDVAPLDADGVATFNATYLVLKARAGQ